MKYIYILLCFGFPVLCTAGGEEDAKKVESFNLLDNNVRENFMSFVKNPNNRNTIESLRLCRELFEFCDFFDVEKFFSGEFPNLQLLYFRCSKTPSEGMIGYLLAGMRVPNLKELILRRNGITLKDIDCLRKIKLPSLEYLDLAYNEIGDEEVKLLCRMDLKKLSNVDLSYNNITSEGVRFFSEINLMNLKQLNLSHNSIRPDGIHYLRKIDLRELEELDLSNNHIGDEGMQFLSELDLPKLRCLNVSHNNITDEGIKYFSTMRLPSLCTLNLSHNSITDTGIKYLSTLNLPRLDDLNLSENPIGQKGIVHLKKAPFSSSIKILNLKNTNLTPTGAAHFVQGTWDNLRMFIIDQTISGLNDLGSVIRSQNRTSTLPGKEFKTAEHIMKANCKKLL